MWGVGNSGPPLGIRGNGEWGVGEFLVPRLPPGNAFTEALPRVLTL